MVGAMNTPGFGALVIYFLPGFLAFSIKGIYQMP